MDVISFILGLIIGLILGILMVFTYLKFTVKKMLSNIQHLDQIMELLKKK